MKNKIKLKISFSLGILLVSMDTFWIQDSPSLTCYQHLVLALIMGTAFANCILLYQIVNSILSPYKSMSFFGLPPMLLKLPKICSLSAQPFAPKKTNHPNFKLPNEGLSNFFLGFLFLLGKGGGQGGVCSLH